jgi:hypothetical protein
MKLEDIRTMLNQDVLIDNSNLNHEATILPQLHNKYLCLLTDEKLLLSKLESELKILARDKWLYYSGKMSEQELKDRNWETFELSLLKTDLDRFITSDVDIINLENKCTLQKEKVYYLENSVKLISNKIWNIRAALDWIKFTQGI